MTQSSDSTPSPSPSPAPTPQQTDKDKKIKALKGEANRTSDFADMLAKKIPVVGETIDGFRKWIEDYELGFSKYTPDKADDSKPWGNDYSKRPRVKIISEGTENK